MRSMQHFNYLKPWPNGLARVQSQHKFAKPELAYGLDAMRWVAKRIASRLASSRKFTQVAKSRSFHAYTVGLRSTFVDLGWVKNLRRLGSCVRILARPKSS